jgi:hypothetical protein
MARNGDGQAFRNSTRYRDHEADKAFADTCGKCGARRIDRQIGLEATPSEVPLWYHCAHTKETADDDRGEP